MSILCPEVNGPCTLRVCRRLATIILFALWFASAFGQLTYRDLHDFTAIDGEYPFAGLSFDASGNAYGTTSQGGANGWGNVWEVTTAGVFKDLHDFGGATTYSTGSSGLDGEYSYAGVAFDAAGNAFGTAIEGGANNKGIIWEVTTAGVYTDIHDFGGTITYSNGSTGPDGADPYGGVTFDDAGNAFGTTDQGGANENTDGGNGIVWEITANGAYKDLHDFGGTVTLSNGTSGVDGENPIGGVTVSSAGNLFGTTENGGATFTGIVWEIESGGTYVDLHDFGGKVINADGTFGEDGLLPNAGVTLDSKGDKFGTASDGGPNDGGIGMVWEITSGGEYKDLHDFGGTIVNADGTSGPDGGDPIAGVTLDSSGNLYGTTGIGGANNVSEGGFGMVWEITSAGAYKDLHDFGGTVINANGTSGSDGGGAYAGVTLDQEGNLYGTAEAGGPGGYGMIWELARAPVISSLTLSPSTIGGLGSTTATVTLATNAPLGGDTVSVHAGASGYLSMPASVTIPAGATSVAFTITGLAQRPSTLKMGVFASDATNSIETILTIQGDSLTRFTLSPSQIRWTSGTSTATLTIGSAAPPGGWIVTLTPGVSGYVNMPTTVTIPAGSTSTTCSITGNALRFFTLDLGITASDGGSKATSTLVIAGDAVKSITLSPSTIGWGGTSTATVNLVAAAPPGGWLVNTNPGAKGYVTMPSSVTVPAGATSATFTITAGSQRSSNLTMGIYANDGPSDQSATLTIQGDSVKSLTLNPSTITALGASTATVTLSSAAPPGGWLLTLHPGASGYVSMPSTLTVPVGATSATFTITGIVQHSSTIDLGIFASDGNSSQEALLTIT